MKQYTKLLSLSTLTLPAIFIPAVSTSCKNSVEDYNEIILTLRDKIKQIDSLLENNKLKVEKYKNETDELIKFLKLANAYLSELKESYLEIKRLIERIDDTLKKIKEKLSKEENPNGDQNLVGFSSAEFNYETSDFFSTNKATKIDVQNVADGDTLKVNNNARIRFAGVDTPETHWYDKKSNKFYDTDGAQYKYGKIAENYTRHYLENAKAIFLVPQKTKSDKNFGEKNYFDFHGRIVGIIYYRHSIDNQIYCLNTQLLFFGIGRMQYISLDTKSYFYTENTKFYYELEKATNHARLNSLGIFDSSKVSYSEIFPKG
ncbi:thermonuclease family protein [Metamycoplasma equirhinis]|uniref:thermonuclease family protein n=1 Tax=Metamycoplasma equirhinis TaxID=92402 RepID=UPI00359C6F8C